MATVGQIVIKLEQWGVAVVGSTAGYARPSCLLGLYAGGGDAGACIPFSPEVELTERAVCMLEGVERAVVVEHYTHPEATSEQHYWALRMSRSRYYRVLKAAYVSLGENFNHLENGSGTKKTGIRNKNYKMQQEMENSDESVGIT